MLEEIMLLLYLDHNLIRDLHATIIDGYIESETVRYSVENENSNQFRFEVENNKSIDKDDKLTCEKECEAEFSVCDKQEHKKDIEHKKIYFASGDDSSSYIKFFYSSWQKMRQLNRTRNIDKLFQKQVCFGNGCACGEFVDFHGELTPISILGYVTKLIEIIDAYTPDKLDDYIKKSHDAENKSNNYQGEYDFTIIQKLLRLLQEDLKSGGTEDFIVYAETYSIIINVCSQGFDARHIHIYDSCSCKCRIWGKVCKIVDEMESIKLLRKTGQVEYYEELLKTFEPYFDCLRKNHIIIPKKPPVEIEGPTIIVKALSINL